MMTDEELDRLAARWLHAIYEEDLALLVAEIRVLRHALQECADAYDIADVQEAISLARKIVYGEPDPVSGEPMP